MRVLLIDEEAKRRVAQVVGYAAKREHWYEPELGGTIPGDNPNLVVHLNTFRCVFSFTMAEGKLWKHLSISVPSDKYPNVITAFTIAELFGFTGWDGKTEAPAKDWVIRLNKPDHCVTLAQVGKL